jgi:hypothetical protein
VSVPTFFIVGAPRCGTTSLSRYLASHPRVFMCSPKEPHHFGSDLPRRFWTPYTDREAYLRLFDAAGDRRAGDASTHYLYSRAAPGEMLTVSPDARILIMLRDPVEMVRSVHDHAMFFGYEDLPDLEQALAAQEDRRQGRRVPRLCHYPLALQYTFTARYAAHVRRYLDAFGRERVKILLFDDLKARTEETYHETLAFLGLPPAGSPDFNVHNEARRWRSPGIARVALSAYYPAYRVWVRSPDRFRGKFIFGLAILLVRLQARFNMGGGRSQMSPELGTRLRGHFQDDVGELQDLIGRDLSSWLPRSR